MGVAFLIRFDNRPLTIDANNTKSKLAGVGVDRHSLRKGIGAVLPKRNERINSLAAGGGTGFLDVPGSTSRPELRRIHGKPGNSQTLVDFSRLNAKAARSHASEGPRPAAPTARRVSESSSADIPNGGVKVRSYLALRPDHRDYWAHSEINCTQTIPLVFGIWNLRRMRTKSGPPAVRSRS